MSGRWMGAVAGVLAALACTDGRQTSDAGTPPPAHDKVYVAAEMQGTVDVLDAETLQPLRSVDLTVDHAMYMPHNVQVAPDGNTLWITAPPMPGHGVTEEHVVVMDPRTDAIVARVVLGETLHLAHVVVDEESRYAYVTAYTPGTVYRIDVVTHALSAFAELGADRGPHGVRICGGVLYVANMDGASVAAVDLASGAVTETPLGGMAVQTACTPDGRYVFVSLFDTREVVRLERASGQQRRIALPAEARGPIQLYPSPDSQRMYVADQGVLQDRPASNALYELSVPAGVVARTITVGQGAHGVVVNPDGTRAFVTNLVDNTVSVVDTEARAVVATIPTGVKPNGVTYWDAW